MDATSPQAIAPLTDAQIRASMPRDRHCGQCTRCSRDPHCGWKFGLLGKDDRPDRIGVELRTANHPQIGVALAVKLDSEDMIEGDAIDGLVQRLGRLPLMVTDPDGEILGFGGPATWVKDAEQKLMAANQMRLIEDEESVEPLPPMPEGVTILDEHGQPMFNDGELPDRSVVIVDPDVPTGPLAAALGSRLKAPDTGQGQRLSVDEMLIENTRRAIGDGRAK